MWSDWDENQHLQIQCHRSWLEKGGLLTWRVVASKKMKHIVILFTKDKRRKVKRQSPWFTHNFTSLLSPMVMRSGSCLTRQDRGYKWSEWASSAGWLGASLQIRWGVQLFRSSSFTSRGACWGGSVICTGWLLVTSLRQCSRHVREMLEGLRLSVGLGTHWESQKSLRNWAWI